MPETSPRRQFGLRGRRSFTNFHGVLSFDPESRTSSPPLAPEDIDEFSNIRWPTKTVSSSSSTQSLFTSRFTSNVAPQVAHRHSLLLPPVETSSPTVNDKVQYYDSMSGRIKSEHKLVRRKSALLDDFRSFERRSRLSPPKYNDLALPTTQEEMRRERPRSGLLSPPRSSRIPTAIKLPSSQRDLDENRTPTSSHFPISSKPLLQINTRVHAPGLFRSPSTNTVQGLITSRPGSASPVSERTVGGRVSMQSPPQSECTSPQGTFPRSRSNGPLSPTIASSLKTKEKLEYPRVRSKSPPVRSSSIKDLTSPSLTGISASLRDLTTSPKVPSRGRLDGVFAPPATPESGHEVQFVPGTKLRTPVMPFPESVTSFSDSGTPGLVGLGFDIQHHAITDDVPGMDPSTPDESPEIDRPQTPVRREMTLHEECLKVGEELRRVMEVDRKCYATFKACAYSKTDFVY